LQSIVDWGARNGATRFYVSAIALYGGISLRLASARGYANAQIEAKRAQMGAWGGSFIEPWRIELACDQPDSCCDMQNDSDF
jgi:hypothetical protein